MPHMRERGVTPCDFGQMEAFFDAKGYDHNEHAFVWNHDMNCWEVYRLTAVVRATCELIAVCADGAQWTEA